MLSTVWVDTCMVFYFIVIQLLVLFSVLLTCINTRLTCIILVLIGAFVGVMCFIYCKHKTTQ